MNGFVCLDPRFSTTRRLTRSKPSDAGNALGSYLALPAAAGRKGEGGLRVNGYFKQAEEGGNVGGAPRGKPLITIITAVFNGEKTLEKSILSVLSQSYDNIEYIVVDGGSRDGTIDILKQYEHAIDYWVSQPDAGIYDAWNRGVRLATGDWIAFLGADDAYADNAIAGYVDFIAAHQPGTLEYVSSKVNLIRDAQLLRVVGHAWQWPVFRRYMGVAHVGSMHRRALFEKYGLFDDSYKICGDYELLLRPRDTLGAAFFDAVTVDMEVGGVSDANVRVFDEAARAKILSGKRGALVCHLEKHWAKLKWRMRKYLLK